MAVGGTPLNHTPPHVVNAVYAIYSHLAHGDLDPVPFQGGPISRNGVTALQFEPSSRFKVMDPDRRACSMTDFLLVRPAATP